jgi:hypothetical protein
VRILSGSPTATPIGCWLHLDSFSAQHRTNISTLVVAPPRVMLSEAWPRHGLRGWPLVQLFSNLPMSFPHREPQREPQCTAGRGGVPPTAHALCTLYYQGHAGQPGEVRLVARERSMCV